MRAIATPSGALSPSFAYITKPSNGGSALSGAATAAPLAGAVEFDDAERAATHRCSSARVMPPPCTIGTRGSELLSLPLLASAFFSSFWSLDAASDSADPAATEEALDAAGTPPPLLDGVRLIAVLDLVASCAFAFGSPKPLLPESSSSSKPDARLATCSRSACRCCASLADSSPRNGNDSA